MSDAGLTVGPNRFSLVLRALVVAVFGGLLLFMLSVARKGDGGELAVFLTYGPLLCAGAYVVQRGEVPLRIVLLAAPLGLLVAAFLFINEFPDARADAASDKRTLVVRLGRPLAAQAFVLFPIVAFTGLFLLPFVTSLPRGIWLGFAGLPHAVLATRRLRASPDVTREIIPAQAWTLLSFCLLALGSAIGMLLLG